MRDYQKNGCTTCTHYYVCQIRDELSAWVDKHHYPLNNATSTTEDVPKEFADLLSKWCCRKDIKKE